MPSSNTPAELNGASLTDKSVGFFNDVFGTGWQNILDGTNSSGGAGEFVQNLYYSLNSVCLAGVTVLLFYVVSAGIVGTAHEGESLGKRYSTLYTPLRSALAISFLMPLPWAKMSLFQALMLKFIFLSIGAASYLASNSVDFMIQKGGSITAPTAPMPVGDALAAEMLKNLTVQEYYAAREESDYGGGDGITDTSESDSRSFVYNVPSGGGHMISSMASINASCNSGAIQSICEAEIQAAKELSQKLRPIAKDLASMWSEGAQAEIGRSQANDYQQAIIDYGVASQSAANSVLSNLDSQYSSLLAPFKQEVANNGWAWLGVYYWKFGRINEQAHAAIASKVSVFSPLDESWLSFRAHKEYELVMIRYKEFIDYVEQGRLNQIKIGNQNDSAGLGALAGSFFMDGIGSSFGSDTQNLGAATILARAASNGDPINNFQKLGHQLINAGTIMLTGAWSAKFVGFLADKTDLLGGPGTSLTANVLKGISGDILAGVMILLLPVSTILIVVGATFAYYLPSVPFILWTSAVVGWLVLTMELMVAASIWAAMHAVPEGEGMAGQHGRQGYMLFFGILFRPSLHVIGFFLAFVLTFTISKFVGESYVDYAGVDFANHQVDGVSASFNTPFGPLAHVFGWLVTIFIGGGIIITSTHKAYSLITWLPDNILRWAGGNMPSLGEHGDEHKVSQMFVGGLNKTQQVMEMVGKKGEKARQGEPQAAIVDHSHHSPGEKK